MRWLGLVALVASLCYATISYAGPTTSDDPDFLTLQAGAFDIRHAHTGIVDLEYMSSYKILGISKPVAGMFVTSKGATYEYGGFGLDLYFGRRWTATWTEAIGAYERGALLKKHCEQKLAEAKMKVEKISFAADGSVTTQPADLG